MHDPVRTDRDDVSVASSPTSSNDSVWIQEGPETIPGVIVVEGPATIIEGRVPVQLLCQTSAQFGPGNRIVAIRKTRKQDENVLKAIDRCDVLQNRRDNAIEESKREAASQQRAEEREGTKDSLDRQSIGRDDVASSSSPARPAEKILSAVYGARNLKASYKTRGTLDGKSNKQRKMNYFRNWKRKSLRHEKT